MICYKCACGLIRENINKEIEAWCLVTDSKLELPITFCNTFVEEEMSANANSDDNGTEKEQIEYAQ